MAITADKIITGVNRRISNPQTQGLLTNEDILAFCNDIVQEEIIPIIESANQDFFVRTYETEIITGQSLYDIPYRAIARALREIKIRDQPTGQFIRNLALVAIEDAYTYYQWVTTVGFYFEGDKIRLVPDVPSNGANNQSLLYWYRLAPSELVQPIVGSTYNVATVTGVSGATVNVDAVPGTMTTGTNIDFVQGVSGNTIYYMDVPIVSTSFNSITFDSSDDVPSGLIAGDYICLSQQSPVLNFIPNEAYPLVETLTARRCLQAISDYEGIKVLDVDAERGRNNLLKILEPRIDGEPTIVVNYWSIARGYKQNQRSWLYGQ